MKIAEYLKLENPDFNVGLSLLRQVCNQKPVIDALERFGKLKLQPRGNPLFGKLIYLLKKYADSPVTVDVQKGVDNTLSVANVDGQIVRGKEITLALLKRNWNDLSHAERQYFNSDEITFYGKKASIIEVSQIKERMNYLHAQLDVVATDEERETISIELLALDAKRIEGFEFIDFFGDDSTVEQVEETEPVKEVSAFERLAKLRVQRSKLTQKIQEKPTDAKLNEWKFKLAEVENQIALLNDAK